MIMTRSAFKFWHGRELPTGVAYLKKPILGDFEQIMWSDIFAKRKAKQEANLRYKRRSDHSIKPCYIWVFYNPTVIFNGWFIYIKTFKKDYALNWKKANYQLVEKIMASIPLGIFPMYGYFESWAFEFSRAFSHQGFKRNENQGLKKARCIIQRGKIEDIIL